MNITMKLLGAVLLLLIGMNIASAKQTVNLTVLSDIGESESTQLKAIYIEEFRSIISGEFDLKLKEVNIDWSSGDPSRQIDDIYRDPNLDMLLVLGFAANQLMIKRSAFPKTTFLPFVIESELVGAPFKDGSSGKRNLNYLTYSLSFLDALEELSAVVEYQNVGIVADRLVLESIPETLPELMNARFEGVGINLISIDDKTGDVIDLIPEDVDAVMVGLVPRLSDEQIDDFIAGLIERKLPSFSYIGTQLVRRGLLATPTNDSLLTTAARRNALNMQAVLLGEAASSLPVIIESKPKLTINQSTAEKIGVAVDFKVLINAEVIGFGEGVDAVDFDLVSLVNYSLQNNLQIKDQVYSYNIQEQTQRLARSSLLPQLSVSASQLKRKNDSAIVQSGAAAEESTDVVLNLSQSLFSDSDRANYQIQKLVYEADGELLRQTRLDVIRETALGMADVLQARAEARIQQQNLAFSEKNLELAEGRVKLGASSTADQYRWQTEVANGKSAVFGSFSNVLTSENNLNRIINRPVDTPLKLQNIDYDAITVFPMEKLFQLMDNADSFERLYKVGLDEAFYQSPEIKRLASLIKAKERELKTLKRQRWLPNLSLSGQVSDNIDQAGLQTNEGTGQDWQVILNAQIPFYRGGQIKAQQETGQLELEQLENQRVLTQQQISQTLRSSMNTLLTSLFNLEFSTQAAEAAELSLDLVTDSYSKGAVNIVDLLDAQTSSVNANLAEVQASINLFRSGIEMQRTVGEYEFLMTKEQRSQDRQEINDALLEAGLKPIL